MSDEDMTAIEQSGGSLCWPGIVDGLREEVTRLRARLAAEEQATAEATRQMTEWQRREKEAVAAKDGAYGERNRCVAFMARMAWCLGWATWRGEHDRADTSWDADWRNIVFIMAPTGQLSWHIHDSELPLFSWIPRGLTAWDGHHPAEKYERMAAFKTPFSSSLLEQVERAEALRRLREREAAAGAEPKLCGCGYYPTQVCVLPEGHSGPHRLGGSR